VIIAPFLFSPPTVVGSLALPIIRRLPRDTSRAARLDPLRLRGGDTINRADESRTRIGIHEESRRVTNSRSATGRGFPPFIPPVGPSILQVFIARLGFPRDLKSLAQQERNNHSRFYDGGHEGGRRTAIKIAHETEGVSVLPTRTLVFAHYLDTPSLSPPSRVIPRFVVLPPLVRSDFMTGVCSLVFLPVARSDHRCDCSDLS